MINDVPAVLDAAADLAEIVIRFGLETDSTANQESITILPDQTTEHAIRHERDKLVVVEGLAIDVEDVLLAWAVALDAAGLVIHGREVHPGVALDAAGAFARPSDPHQAAVAALVAASV